MKKSFLQLRTVVLSLMLVFSLSMVCVNVVEAATLSRKKVTMYEGDTTTLRVNGALKTVKWTSSNKKVVSIKRTTGKRKYKATLLAKKKGKATIKAKYKGLSLKATVTVKHSHKYTVPATCKTPKSCVCGKLHKKYVLGEHNWSGAACNQVCAVCGATRSVAAHNYTIATCQQQSTCTVCGQIGSGYGQHKYSAATCTKPATCEYCKGTQGTVLQHQYSAATCTKLATCVSCGATTGSKAPHQYLSEATCISCGHIELYNIVDFWIKRYGQSSFVTVGVDNNSARDNLFIGASTVMNGFYATVNIPGLSGVRALLDRDYDFIFLPGQEHESYFDMERTYDIKLGTRITFFIDFKNHIYEITASSEQIHNQNGHSYYYTYRMIK